MLEVLHEQRAGRQPLPDGLFNLPRSNIDGIARRSKDERRLAGKSAWSAVLVWIEAGNTAKVASLWQVTRAVLRIFFNR